MKAGIMQPYLFPYIGYWQLIHAVDRFVLLDDVNYIMRGYINRNSILLDGKPYRFTIPVKKASQNKLIKEMELDFDRSRKDKFLRTLCSAYKKADYYEAVMPVLEEIVNYEEESLTEFIRFSIARIMDYLQIHTELSLSSEIKKKETLRGEERIIEICKRLNVDTYVNPCGGRMLYDHSDFEREKLNLFFLDTQWEKVVYDQKQNMFTKNLSIIDVMMFNDIRTIQMFLERYELHE